MRGRDLSEVYEGAGTAISDGVRIDCSTSSCWLLSCRLSPRRSVHIMAESCRQIVRRLTMFRNDKPPKRLVVSADLLRSDDITTGVTD